MSLPSCCAVTTPTTSSSPTSATTWADNPAWRRLLAGEILARLTAADTAALAAAQHGPARAVPAGRQHLLGEEGRADTAGSLAALSGPRPALPGGHPGTDRVAEERRRNPRLEELTARWFAPAPAWLQEAEQQAAEHRAEIDAELETPGWPSGPPRTRSAPGGGQLVQWLTRNPETSTAFRPGPPGPDRRAVLPATGQLPPRGRCRLPRCTRSGKHR